MEFDGNGAVVQTTNISGPVIEMPGKWEASDTQLTLELLGPNGETGSMVYNYSFEDNVLVLNWKQNGGWGHTASFTGQ
jgi:hypothetical protein